jgi:hypothetical protein
MGLRQLVAGARISMRHMEMRTFMETFTDLMTTRSTRRPGAFALPLR